MDEAQLKETLQRCLTRGLPLNPLPPPLKSLDTCVPHAPPRQAKLTPQESKQAVANALRYFPCSLHETLAPEFAAELRQYGHIYMRRFKPTEYPIRAYPQQLYPASLPAARCMMLMIMNNLDPSVAQYPDELVTYGGNGSVFSNWAQYHLVMQYLSQMTDTQTLTMYSGHPMGLFPSLPFSPRVTITNGLTVPNYSSKAEYERYYAMGVSMYGQMTAGSWAYIGPQGIVHGTTITLASASRKWLHRQDLSGHLFVSSGLGGMSGAQPKAAKIVNGIAVIAEVDESALNKRLKQGWVDERIDQLDVLIQRVKTAKSNGESVSLAYHGNVVNLWERLAKESDLVVDLGSDQTSLHNALGGGYIPVGLSLVEARQLLVNDASGFKAQVYASLRRQCAAIAILVERGMHFFDYGNSFLLEASRSGADIFAKHTPRPNCSNDNHTHTTSTNSSRSSDNDHSSNRGTSDSSGSNTRFIYPSYVEAFMGDIFSCGFGPFRWVCSSGLPSDLHTTDQIAASVLTALRAQQPPPSPFVDQNYADNLHWVQAAESNHLVVGSQARILYADAAARIGIAHAFNVAIKAGTITAPVIVSRDHHDCSSVDSPFRETSNIQDGSMFTADMAVQNVIGDAFRGATWVSLHNGGGTGWGESINGGFGLVLDGTQEAEQRLENMLYWDVYNGIARRAWSGNQHALATLHREVEKLKTSSKTAHGRLVLTEPYRVAEGLMDAFFDQQTE